MTQSEIPVIRARHIYDIPEVYEVIYFRSKGFKFGEAHIFAYIMQREKPDAKTILELFAGEDSKHRKVFLEEYAFADRIESYKGTDGAITIAGDRGVNFSDETMFIEDLVTVDWGGTYDALFGYFFSADCVVDFENGGYVTRERTVALLKNAYKHLNPGGILLLDSCEDGFSVSTDPTQVADISQRYVDYTQLLNRMLREKYNIPITPSDEVELVTTSEHWYDRENANSVDKFEGFEVKVNGEVVLRYEVELPMCVRYFSEPEIRDMLTEAGFDRIDQWYADYEGHDVFKLETVLQWEKGATIEDRKMQLGNLFAAFKE